MSLAPAPIPDAVAANVAPMAGGREWLESLPVTLERLCAQWGLTPGPAAYGGGSCAWTGPVRTAEGAHAVLKVGWPHRESRGEAAALRFWDGAGAVRLLAESAADSALLLEECAPGTTLAADTGPAEERLATAAALLAELHGRGAGPAAELEPVGVVTAEWADLTAERVDRLDSGYDPHLVGAAIALLRALPGSAVRRVVVHGDFNPGNVLAAERRPWLAIDPKPMVGDPGYDPWPLVMQVDAPLRHSEPVRVLRRRFGLVADVLREPVERLLAWAFARQTESAFDLLNRGRPEDAARDMADARVLADAAGV